MSHLGYLRGETTTRPARRPLLQQLKKAVWGGKLTEYTLRGPRPAGPIRLLIARDVSASMLPYAPAREAAVAELLTWAPHNLRPHDQLGILDFADTAQWALRPLAMHHLHTFGASLLTTDLDTGGTQWLPTTDRVSGLPDSPARTSLWLVSDGLYPDYPTSPDMGQRTLRRAGIHSMPLLIPTNTLHAPQPWQDTFPDEPCLTFDGTNPRSTALAFLHAIATLTGQHLIHSPN